MKRISKVAVLGAGTMGARIAAHFANAGVPSYLFDIVPPDADVPARNKIAAAGLDAAKKSKPAAFMETSLAKLVTVGNFEDDLKKLAEVDWIIEAVVENLEIKRSLLIEQVLKSDVENKSVVTWAETQAFYDRNASRFQIPESYSFQSISILPPLHPTADQQKEAAKRANDYLKQAQAMKSYQDFGLLAEKISEDDFRVNMGLHKSVEKDKLPPQIIKAFSTMKPGAVSGLISIESAYTIVRLDAHTPAGKQSFESVKAGLKTELQKTKYESLRVSLDKFLRARAQVQIL